MKNDTNFVRVRSGDHLGDAQNVEKGQIASSSLIFFINCDRRKWFSQNERRGLIYKKLPHIFNFCLELSYDLSKFSDDFTPFFRLWKTITKSVGNT